MRTYYLTSKELVIYLHTENQTASLLHFFFHNNRMISIKFFWAQSLDMWNLVIWTLGTWKKNCNIVPKIHQKKTKIQRNN